MSRPFGVGLGPMQSVDSVLPQGGERWAAGYTLFLLTCANFS